MYFFLYWNGVIADEICHNSSAIVFLFLFFYSLADELWHVSSAKLTIADEIDSISSAIIIFNFFNYIL